MLSEKEIPKLVWKYRSWSDEWHQRILTERELYFAPPDALNDSFEFTAFLDYSLGSQEEVDEHFIEHFRQKDPGRPEQEIREEVSSSERGWHRNEILLENFRKYQREFFIRNYGVFSCSLTHDQILMWSHYADANKGFCVGFDPMWLVSHFAPPEFSVTIDRVRYVDKPPTLNPYRDGLEVFEMASTTKPEAWSYEKEYRLILMGASQRILRVPEECFRVIAIGKDMPPHQRDNITCVLRDWKYKPTLWEQEVVPGGTFEFRYQQIPY